MSTLWLLGLRDEFEGCGPRRHVSFDPLDIQAKFETTIRVWAGGERLLLSGDGRLLDAAGRGRSRANSLGVSVGDPVRASPRCETASTPSTGATCRTAPAGTLLLDSGRGAPGGPDLEELRRGEPSKSAHERVSRPKLKMTPSSCATVCSGRRSSPSGAASTTRIFAQGLAPGGREQTAENVERCRGLGGCKFIKCAAQPRSWPTSRRTRRREPSHASRANLAPGPAAPDCPARPTACARRALFRCVSRPTTRPTNLAPEARRE